jgi:predicted RNA polymerase sigma factor
MVHGREHEDANGLVGLVSDGMRTLGSRWLETIRARTSEAGTCLRYVHRGVFAEDYDQQHRLGRDAEAADAYQAELALSDNVAEREFLAERVPASHAT